MQVDQNKWIFGLTVDNFTLPDPFMLQNYGFYHISSQVLLCCSCGRITNLDNKNESIYLQMRLSLNQNVLTNYAYNINYLLMKQIHFILFLLVCLVFAQQPHRGPSGPPGRKTNMREKEQDRGSIQKDRVDNGVVNNTPTEQEKIIQQQINKNQESVKNKNYERVRRFRNKFQFPIRYEIFMLYTLIVCTAFVVFYMLFRCIRKYKKLQMEKAATEINERYFKYAGRQHKQNNANVILPTFCPNSDQPNQFYSFPNEIANEPIQSPYFGRSQ